jgi:hypothetical protein
MSSETLKILIEFAILVTMGLFMLDILGIISRVNHRLRWNQIEGKIVHTDVRTIFDIVGSSINNYSAQVRYEYTVNDKLYESIKISPIKELAVFRKKTDAKKYLELFPIGKIIPVFYKPHKPEISVLNPKDTEEREENIRFEIIVIFMLLLFYIFLKILDLADVWKAL